MQILMVFETTGPLVVILSHIWKDVVSDEWWVDTRTALSEDPPLVQHARMHSAVPVEPLVLYYPHRVQLWNLRALPQRQSCRP